MKKSVVFLMILSLVMCTACVGEVMESTSVHTASPNVLPTTATTSKPTKESTQPHTDPPLPIGPIDAELNWAATLHTYSKTPAFRGGYYNLAWSDTLHSTKEIESFLQENFGEYTPYLEIDYSHYDDSFFEDNAVTVLLTSNEISFDWLINITDAERTSNGTYTLHTDIYHGMGGGEWSISWFIIFVEMKGVSDDAVVELIIGKEDLFGGLYDDTLDISPVSLYHKIGEIAPGVLISDLKK